MQKVKQDLANTASITKNQEKFATHRSKLFDVLGTFLADCICFTAKNKDRFQAKTSFNEIHWVGVNESWTNITGRWNISPFLLKLRSAVCALHYWVSDATLLQYKNKEISFCGTRLSAGEWWQTNSTTAVHYSGNCIAGGAYCALATTSVKTPM